MVEIQHGFGLYDLQNDFYNEKNLNQELLSLLLFISHSLILLWLIILLI